MAAAKASKKKAKKKTSSQNKNIQQAIRINSKKKSSRATQKSIQLSIVIPCLNEEETLATCINKAKMSIEKNKINAEIIVADNGGSSSI